MKVWGLYCSIFLLLSIFGIIRYVPLVAYAHQDSQRITKDYKVAISQDPLSPFVNEEVKINFSLDTSTGIPAAKVKGTLLIKDLSSNSSLDKDIDHKEKIIYQKDTETDLSGNVELVYEFKNAGLYDVEFIWGQDKVIESAGLEILARDPVSFFTKQELLKRLWIFTLVALAGFLIGVILTFILLTMSFRPKK